MKSRTPTILIVDDIPANIDVLRKTLETENYNISIALNGEGALDLVCRSLPDLILLDVMMPGMDGFEVCRKLKANDATCGVPIIFITAKDEPRDIVKGLKLGGVDYIAKPFHQEEVCARVKTQLHIQQLMEEQEVKNRELLELNDLKNKFLGMASHDLRGSLASICGFSEVLLNEIGSLSEKKRMEFTRIIFSASEKLLVMVNDLLDISAIESGTLELKLFPGSIKELVEERIRIHEFKAKKKDINFHSSLQNLPDFDFDSSRVSQILDNLISNAVKFSPPGKEVYLSLEQNGETRKVSVRD